MTGHARISLAAWGATVLGSLVLTPVFSGPFLFVSAFLCALITGIGVLLQNLRAPRIVVPIIQLVALVELLSLFFLHGTMKAGLIPWKGTAIQFNAQMVDAMDSINRFSAPLPQDAHLTLFAVSVISATGLLIHVIAVQLRQAAWAGLLLLIMYTVPAATVHGGLPALLFIPPAVGYILLLSAEGRSRLSRWGRRISGISHLDAAEPVEASALGQAGRRIGLSVVALAALLPALLPALPEGVVGNGLAGGGTGGGGGGGPSGAPPPAGKGEKMESGGSRRGPGCVHLGDRPDAGHGQESEARRQRGGADLLRRSRWRQLHAADRTGPLRRQHLADLAAAGRSEDQRRSEPAIRLRQ